MAHRTRSQGRLQKHGDRTGLLTGISLAAAALLVLGGMTVVAHVWQQPKPAAAPAKGAAPTAAPTVQALAAVVMDRSTGVILYAKAPRRHLPTASLTKIMTALVVLEKTPDLDQSVAVPAAAIGQHGAGIGLRLGDQITYRELLLGLMVKSATDCAVTLATAVAGDEPSFAVLMNARAAEMGLRDTHFVNCTGLNVPGHYSSARDLSELGRIAMRDPQFRSLARRVWARITWSPSRETFVVSRNRLNARYDWVDGIKTGSTEGTGACMVASGKYGGRRLIVTTLHEPNRDQEVKDALGLFAFGASRFSRSVVVRRGERVGEVSLLSGGKAALVAERDLSRVVRNGARVRTKIQAPATLAAPTDEVVGYARFSADGMLLGTVPLRATAP
jgi:serine-type D-Ala-D-Ala carboxypeptidase (penicillin-binding protein 5/6)